MASAADKIVYRSGLRLDAHTAQLWDLLVKRFPGLILTQGVNSGAAASGGTHLGLGVLDFYLGRHANEWRAVLKYAFEIGFYGWYRPYVKDLWKTHIHLGVRGRSGRAASLKAQEISWRNRRNGLRGNGPDAYTWRPSNYKSASKFKAASTLVFRVLQLNIPAPGVGIGGDLGNDSKRIAAAAKTIKARKPHVIGYNELGPVRRRTVIGGTDGLPSVFASALDKAMGTWHRIIKPTLAHNENYIGYDSTRLKIKQQYNDLVLIAPHGSGNKHMTTVVFKHVHGYVIAVGCVHLPPQSTAAGAKDRVAMSKQVWTSMAKVSAQHGNCRFVVVGDMNQPGLLSGLTAGKMKRAREFADKSVGAVATFTTYKAAKPSTNKQQELDHIYWSKSWYVLTWLVHRVVDRAGAYVKPRASDHDVTESDARY